MTITNQQKNIAQWALQYTLQNGCNQARISIVNGNSNSFEYRDLILDRLHRSGESRLHIELYKDGRYGIFSTNRLDKKELERFISDAIDSIRFLAPDPCRKLPDPSRYYHFDPKDNLDVLDTNIDNISVEEKKDLALNAIKEVYDSKEENIITVTSSYEDGRENEYILASNGLEVQSSETFFYLMSEVSMKATGNARAESFWFDSSIFWNQLKKTDIGKQALARAKRKIGQKKIQSGSYSMLLDNTLSSKLLSPILGAMFGSALQQKNSFLLDKLSETIVSEKFTLYDRPHLKQAPGARWYDDEGIKTFSQTLIQEGRLNSYFIDTYHSLKMGIDPTIGSPSILTTELGTKNFEQILSEVNNGIWITSFNGGNTNATTGDFSFGIEGFLIKRGEIISPVSEMNITGNILSLWSKLKEIGNDPRMNSSQRIPSLLFEDVTFSGL